MNLTKADPPTGWLLLLSLLLCGWEPLNLALSASSDLAGLTIGQPIRAAFLAFRLLVASIGIAAGLAIWNRRTHALTLAKLALALSAVGAIVRFAWFPGNVPPGLRLPFAVASVVYNAAWFVYLVILAERQEHY